MSQRLPSGTSTHSIHPRQDNFDDDCPKGGQYAERVCGGPGGGGKNQDCLKEGEKDKPGKLTIKIN